MRYPLESSIFSQLIVISTHSKVLMWPLSGEVLVEVVDVLSIWLLLNCLSATLCEDAVLETVGEPRKAVVVYHRVTTEVF